MSKKDNIKARKERKPLLPTSDDELPFYTQPHIPISLEEIGADKTDQGTPLPDLHHMDDDELPFIEQKHMPISLDELQAAGMCDTLSPTPADSTQPPAEEVLLPAAVQSTATAGTAVTSEPVSEEGTECSDFPELRHMDDDELPFTEQSYVPISLTELDGLSEPPPAAASKKAPAKRTRTAARKPAQPRKSNAVVKTDMLELRHMDDDELPFTEQSYVPISLTELDGLSEPPPAAVPKKAPAKRTRTATRKPTQARKSNTVVKTDMLELRHMDDDELPFTEQSYVPISLTELDGLSEPPPAAVLKKAPAKKNHAATARSNRKNPANRTKTSQPTVKKKVSPAKREALPLATTPHGADDGTERK